MGSLATLELGAYRQRVNLMAAAALVAIVVDFFSKTTAIALMPDGLLFNVSTSAPLDLGSSLILVAGLSSLLACVLPTRAVAIGAGVALGGAVGNLTSRYLWADQGGSPDFIPFGDGSTGNLADVCILVGALAMLLGAVVWLGWTAAVSRRRG
jgi:signal peptidase II